METLTIQIVRRNTPTRKTKLAYDVVVNGEVKNTRHSNREYNFGFVQRWALPLNREKWHMDQMRKHLNQFDKQAIPHCIYPVIITD